MNDAESSVPLVRTDWEFKNDDPTDLDYCPGSDSHWHCPCWSDCEPCHYCGDDTPDPMCDCDRCTAVRQDLCREADEQQEEGT